MKATRRHKKLLKKIHHRIHPVANRLQKAAKTRRQKDTVRSREKALKASAFSLLKRASPDVAIETLNTALNEGTVMEMLEVAAL